MKHKRRTIYIITAIAAIITAFQMVSYVLLPIYASFRLKKETSGSIRIGIIGGADGPTSIYLANSNIPIFYMIVPLAILVIGGVYLIRTRKGKKKF